MSKLTKLLYGAACFTTCISTSGQVRIVNSPNNTSVQNSSAFIDASSNDSFNQSINIGKGLLYPRTHLTTFTSFNGIVTSSANNFPTLFDGMIVYNVDNGGVAGVGETEGTLCRGFWYYDNPTGTLNGGTWRPSRPCPGTITNLDCNDANIVRTGSLTAGVGASGVTFTMTYNGGNGGAYSAQSVSSIGITGLTATLVADNFNNGTGTLTYMVTGTPSGAGSALFVINIGGAPQCSVSFTVGSAVAACGAYIAPGVYKEFMCHNLGADTSFNPFTPTYQIHGFKYQWGKATPALTLTEDMTNMGPIAGWNTTPAPNGSWLDITKTANDPCPTGYRVPTQAQWQGVIDNNALTVVGTPSTLPNYTAALKFGTNLMLPFTTSRSPSNGSGPPPNSTSRSQYWTSSQSGTSWGYLDISTINMVPLVHCYYLVTSNSGSEAFVNAGLTANAVRCIKE